MRTRFPPSPTGFLHIGALRTALFCYLLAKKDGDDFVLRIEDTDQGRFVEGAIEDFLTTLHWCGLDPDEGVVLEDGSVSERGDKGPYMQSQRFDLYREHAEQLIASGHAYYAFDTKEELDQMREEEVQHGVPSPKYNVSTRKRMKNSLTLSEEEVQAKLAANEPHVVRLLVPENRTITCHDEIRGKCEYQNHTVDDTILLKSDGFPTYHLANVVDDHLMEIAMVLRGEEWLPSLPKHVLLYEAFGWDMPKFAHVPLILNKEGGKLSKRQNSVAVRDYIAEGYLPEAVLNFIAQMGWNPGTTQELFSLEEMVEQFSLDRVQKGGAVFDRDKLEWLQGQWMRKMPLEDFAARIRPLVEEAYPAAKDDADFNRKAVLIQERITFFKEAPEMLSYYYSEPELDMEIVANKKQKVTAEMVPEIVQLLIDTLEPIAEADWNHDHLKDVLFAVAQEKELKNGQVLWPLRAILTGLPFSPGAFEVAEALGKAVTMRRLQEAQNQLL